MHFGSYLVCHITILSLGNKGTNSQQPPTSQSNNTGWGQQGSKSQANNVLPPTTQPTTSSNPPNNNGPSSNTKQQLEQLTSMREAIFSQDGWGGVSINDSTFISTIICGTKSYIQNYVF